MDLDNKKNQEKGRPKKQLPKGGKNVRTSYRKKIKLYYNTQKVLKKKIDKIKSILVK